MNAQSLELSEDESLVDLLRFYLTRPSSVAQWILKLDTNQILLTDSADFSRNPGCEQCIAYTEFSKDL